MKKVLFGMLIGVVMMAVLISLGTMIFAQEQRMEIPENVPIVVLGGLKLKPEADPQGAEKLFKEQLIPALTGIEGLSMKVLKRIKMPNEQADPKANDYMMMAEMANPQVFMQLMQSRDSRLDKFGDMMKEYAGEPGFEMYTILAKTEVPKSE